MRYELKSVGIWAFTKVSFFINLPVGFILGLLYAAMLPFMMMGMAEFGGFPGGAIDPSDMPIGIMLIILPIVCAMFAAVFHTIVGVVLLAIYNLIVRMIGGLEFELDPVKVAQSATPVRPVATYAGVGDAAVLAPPVSSTPSTSVSPPPPPTVPGVSEATAPSGAQVPQQATTEIPEQPPAAPFKPTTTEIQSPPPTLRPKPPDDKTDNDAPPAPETI